MLLDTNTVIYLGDVERGPLVQRAIVNERLYTCNVVIAETLGYATIADDDEFFAKKLFAASTNLVLDDEVTQRVIALRKTRRIELPDAIIAATALVNNVTLCTSNTKDFTGIPGLKLFNPLILNDDDITKKLNEVYGADGSKLDPMLNRAQLRALRKEKW